MKLKTLVAATLAGALLFTTGLVASDTSRDLAQATAYRQSIPHLAQKQAVAAKKTGDCTLYGSGCLGDWTGAQHGVDGNPATADVLVVGDSIVNRCRVYLRKRLLAQGLTSVFDYWSSRPTEPAVTAMLAYPRVYGLTKFRAVAMGTGTNDIFDPTVMTGQINRAKVIEAKMVWGSVYAARSGTYSADLRNAGWVNLQIGQSGLPVVDWFAFLAAYPGYRIGAYVTSDGIHPTYDATDPQLGDGSGCDAWAATYTTVIVSQAKR